MAAYYTEQIHFRSVLLPFHLRHVGNLNGRLWYHGYLLGGNCQGDLWAKCIPVTSVPHSPSALPQHLDVHGELQRQFGCGLFLPEGAVHQECHGVYRRLVDLHERGRERRFLPNGHMRQLCGSKPCHRHRVSRSDAASKICRRTYER